MPEFYIIIARKNIFARMLGGGAGNVPPCPSSPTPTSGVLKKQKNKITVYVAFHPNIRIRIFV